MANDTSKPAASRKGGNAARPRKSRGFLRAGALAPAALKTVGAKRGFAELRLLTEWPAIAGAAVAAICKPVKVTYGRRDAPGLGATLVVTTAGARAPEVEMSAPGIIERVNAFYGYRAVSRLAIDQSRAPAMAAGFAEAQAPWTGPTAGAGRDGAAGTGAEARETDASGRSGDAAPRTPGVADDRLALALARLGANVSARAARKDP